MIQHLQKLFMDSKSINFFEDLIYKIKNYKLSLEDQKKSGNSEDKKGY